MSLHKFAEQVASQGRGDDSLLVHMTPDEVRNLQRFAQANGTTLTINPTTGLPEAGLLSDLFKSIAPIALGAFLGPAGLGMSSMMAGLATGGITTLATGSLSRGLMAGLGAYGGAGLGDSLMNAGSAGMASTAGATAGAEAAQQGLSEAARSQAIDEAVRAQGFNEAMGKTAASDVFGAGAKAAMANPMAFAKNNLTNIGMAAAPIMAGAMVPTTTKLGDPKDTGYIRQFDYNINPDTGRPDPLYGMRAMTPVKASEFKDKTFQGQRDLFRQQNPNPYELGVGSLNQPPQQPTPMAGGGIVALANGGVPGYADGALVSDQQIFDYFAAGPKTDEQIARDMGTYNVTTADIARATGTQNQQADYDTRYAKADTKNDIYDYFANADTQALLKSGNDKAIADTLQANDWTLANVAAATGTQGQLGDYGSRYVNAVVDKATDANEFLARATDVGLTGSDLATALQNSGQSAAAQYALTHQLSDASGITDSNNFYNQLGYKTGALPGDQGGLEGLYSNINYSASGLQSLIDSGKMTVAQAQAAARAEMARSGTSEKDVKNATGKSIADLFKPKTISTITGGTGNDTITGGTGNDTITGGTGNDTVTTTTVLPTPFTSVVPGGTLLPGATVYDNGAYGNYGNNTGNPLTSTPGDIITNPDGTRTVVPNLPGRPYGGFSGMNDVRNAYTAGGGSLGYTSPIVKTAAEHEAKYNKLTDDSLDAYNYLMGKGKNLTQRKAETRNRPVMQRYDEAVLGRKIAKPAVKTTETKTVVGVPGNPQSYFNEAEYLAANPDVAAEIKTGKSTSGKPTQFKSAYDHYLMYGKAEGRPFAGDYQGYLTALALADAANASGGGGPGNTTSTTTAASTVSDSNTANSITGLAAPADNSIAVADAVASPASSATPSGGSTSVGDGTAPGATSGDGDSAGDDAVGGYYSRGKLNYRSKDMAMGGATGYAMGGGLGSLGSYSDGGRLLRGPGDGVSDSIPATIGRKQQPARLADGEFVIPARIVSELGNGSTDAGAKKLYAMMDRVQRARGKTTGKNKVAANSRSDKYLPA